MSKTIDQELLPRPFCSSSVMTSQKYCQCSNSACPAFHIKTTPGQWSMRGYQPAGAPLPNGYVLVPVEPTPGMLRAGVEQSVGALPIYKAILAAAPHPVSGEPFQARVLPWLLDCFGQAIADDKTERNHRFLEEALELVQSCGCTEDEAHKLVAYVYGRAVGERSQEVGGVMVTLAALCLAQRLDMHQCGETELSRITQPAMVEKIREKQKRKPSMSPLPGVYPERAQQGEQSS